MDIVDLIKTNPELADSLTIKMSAADLREFAAMLLEGSKQGRPVAPAPPEQEQPISQTEAIAFMGKSRQTFYSWRRKGLIKAHVLGGQCYFFKSELLAALKGGGHV
jgi:hypothetical protein